MPTATLSASPKTQAEPGFGYAEARQTMQWLISARVMFRQSESQQPRPDPVKLAALDQDIDHLMQVWSGLPEDDTVEFDRIKREFEPEVREIFAMLEASDSGSESVQ